MTLTNDEHPTPSRRHLVRLGGASVGLGAAALALAACGGDDEPSANAAAPQGSAQPAADGSAVAAGTTLTTVASVPVGGAVVVKVGEESFVVAQPSAGEVTAFDAKCPHKGCPVVVLDSLLDCPCHHSTFDLLTGAVTKGPATSGLPAVAVTVQGDAVVTA
jgi:nitrite reductase/ring-hydroxylating ferredoxin subunit